MSVALLWRGCVASAVVWLLRFLLPCCCRAVVVCCGMEEPCTPVRAAPLAGSPASGVKRRRLRGKGPPPSWSRGGSPDDAVAAGGPPENAEEELVPAGPPPTADERKVLLNKYSHWWRSKTSFGEKTLRERAGLSAMYNLRRLSPAWRARRLVDFARAFPAQKAEIAALGTVFLHKPAVTHLHFGESFMCTWAGDWGVVPLEALPEEKVASAVALLQPVGPPPAGPLEPSASGPAASGAGHAVVCWERAGPEAAQRSVALIAGACRAVPLAAELAEAARKCVVHLREQHPVVMDAWAVEVCSRSWERERVVRLHVHLCVTFRGRQRIQPHATLRLFDTEPWTTPHWGLAAGTRRRSGEAGIYYCLAPKCSGVCREGSHELFTDVMVHPGWVFSLAQSGKLEFECARAQLARLPASIAKNLENLEKWQRERRQAAVADFLAQRNAVLAQAARPFKRFAQVDLFLGQFQEARDRYRFLVLDGKSRLGKTQFARSLAGADKTLELNCAGSAQPDLRPYDPLQHNTLLWDEAAPSLVLQHKKLFQATTALVQVQTSNTNCHAFSICVAGKMFVVSANDWCEKLARLPFADHEWLTSNSFCLRVAEPMWLPAPPEDLPCSS